MAIFRDIVNNGKKFLEQTTIFQVLSFTKKFEKENFGKEYSL